MVVTNLQCCPF